MDYERRRLVAAVLKGLKTNPHGLVEFEGSILRLTDNGLIELSRVTKREDARAVKDEYQALLGPPLGSGSSSKQGEETIKVFYIWPKARLEEIDEKPKS